MLLWLPKLTKTVSTFLTGRNYELLTGRDLDLFAFVAQPLVPNIPLIFKKYLLNKGILYSMISCEYISKYS